MSAKVFTLCSSKISFLKFQAILFSQFSARELRLRSAIEAVGDVAKPFAKCKEPVPGSTSMLLHYNVQQCLDNVQNAYTFALCVRIHYALQNKVDYDKM